jgi:hypothetical protein
MHGGQQGAARVASHGHARRHANGDSVDELLLQVVDGFDPSGIVQRDDQHQPIDGKRCAADRLDEAFGCRMVHRFLVRGCVQVHRRSAFY